ncbi:hypothetical protein CF328_g3663 [Tilletia controversa]|nr:hypothetical protein CF328_g3663 [Tilletia controversa]
MRFNHVLLLATFAFLCAHVSTAPTPLPKQSTVTEHAATESAKDISNRDNVATWPSEHQNVARKLMRLMGGGLWLAAETAGFALNLLRFNKNYGRDLANDVMEEQPRPRDVYSTAGRAMFAVATVIGAVTLPIAYANSLLLPYPEHPTTKRDDVPTLNTDEDTRPPPETSCLSEHGHMRLSSRNKVEAAAQALGVGSVAISLLGLPLNIALYKHMSPQHLTFTLGSMNF